MSARQQLSVLPDSWSFFLFFFFFSECSTATLYRHFEYREDPGHEVGSELYTLPVVASQSVTQSSEGRRILTTRSSREINRTTRTSCMAAYEFYQKGYTCMVRLVLVLYVILSSVFK